MYNLEQANQLKKLGMNVPDSMIMISMEDLNGIRKEFEELIKNNKKDPSPQNQHETLLFTIEKYVINSISQNEVYSLKRALENDKDRIAEYFGSDAGKQVIGYVVSELLDFLNKKPGN